jgi:hypothetical protein
MLRVSFMTWSLEPETSHREMPMQYLRKYEMQLAC